MAQAEAEASAGHLSHRLSPRPHGHPVAGDLARPEGQAHEASGRVPGIELAQSGCPDELPLAEPHGPAQAAAVGVDALVHVLPVEPEAGLQPQRIPRTQPCREQATPGPRLEQGVPETRGGVGLAVELQTVLPRVTGSGDPAFHSRHRPQRGGEGPQRREVGAGERLDDADRLRALDGEQRGLVALVDDLRGREQVAPHPLEVGPATGRVDHEQEAVLHPVDDPVVDDPTAVVADHRVEGVAGGQRRDVVGDEPLQGGLGALPAEPDLTHVGEVEEAGPGPHRHVLVPDRAVAKRHLVPRKLDHHRLGGDVAGMERGPRSH